jgi:hypothetical protein
MPESPPASIGSRIRHPDWGNGKVLGLVRGGRIVRVEFDEMPGTPWEIPREEIEISSPKSSRDGSNSRRKTPLPEKEGKGKPSPGPKAPGKASLTPASCEKKLEEVSKTDTARQAIEALRLGVVPAFHLNTYTVGRDMELYVVLRDLESAAEKGGLRVVLGDYGTGKTHFLEMAELLALEMGFLAARATLDSREVVANRPRRIFHQLARGIRYPDDLDMERRGLEPLLRKAAADAGLVRRWSNKQHPDYHPYLGAALFYTAVLPTLKNGDDLEERLLDWIEGSEVASNTELENKLRRTTSARIRLYALKDFRTVTHLYTLLLGGISELARQVGYKGLAIMVDEAEFYSVLRGRDRAFSDTLFRTFSAACLPPSMLLFYPEALPRGGQAIHQSFSYRYKNEQPLYCIFALTHDRDGKALLERSLPVDRFMDLTPFKTVDYITLANRVLSLYGLADTKFKPGRDLASLMAKVIEPCHLKGLIENPRQALKFITELVDIARHCPGRLKPTLKALERHLNMAAR